MKKVDQSKRAKNHGLSLFPEEIERLKQYAEKNNLYARGIPSISRAIHHIFSVFNWDSEVKK